MGENGAGPYGRIGEELLRAESALFVGRERERLDFAALLEDPARRASIVHLFGPAGIGKTWLLGRLRQLAEAKGIPWIDLDLQLVSPTPAGVAAALGEALPEAVGRGARTSALEALNALAGERGAVLAIDAAERGISLGGWLRGELLPTLGRRVLVVLAGRYPPDGPWRDSPAWRGLGVEMELAALTHEEMDCYFDRLGIADEDFRRRAAAWSAGLPLLLSRIAARPADADAFPDLALLAEDWLGGSRSPQLRLAAWHASLLRVFDYETLAAASGEEPPDETAFAELLRLPCMARGGSGWHLHQLARESLQAEFRALRPDAWREARERCIAVYERRLGSERDPQRAIWLMQELIFQLADSRLRAVLTMPVGRSGYTLETLDAHNYPEVEDYLARRRMQPRRKAHAFIDYESEAAYTLDMAAEQDAARGRLAKAADWLALRLDSVKLLRSAEGRMIGLFAAIPIHRHSLDLLARRPVTRAYFRGLSVSERLALAAPPSSPAGWYIRMIDAEDPSDGRARSELIQEAIGYLASGGLVLCSTPHPFYRELLLSIGMEPVEGAEHDDYGPGHRAQTFAADLRGSGRQAYMRKLIERRSGGGAAPEEPPYAFTAREREAAGLLLSGLSNPEIAARMFVTEITVKKHVSSLLRKTGCKSRGLLMKRLARYESALLRVDN
ncbi:AAA ATPase domain-containing protein [Cohnella sp. OV330]|uniref:helix-turn-helix transcriptional regulator n=1 Tax=Cohnella sp. OV330 TaxID=1855288 RepID=UPI0008F1A67A|nr:LuxR family transcriptional regulator [Cohnella sp. OV330]SFB55761.1 AAA ATPase domain-containing protein [Cohnella sp. OV330]